MISLNTSHPHAHPFFPPVCVAHGSGWARISSDVSSDVWVLEYEGMTSAEEQSQRTRISSSQRSPSWLSHTHSVSALTTKAVLTPWQSLPSEPSQAAQTTQHDKHRWQSYMHSFTHNTLSDTTKQRKGKTWMIILDEIRGTLWSFWLLEAL